MGSKTPAIAILAAAVAAFAPGQAQASPPPFLFGAEAAGQRAEERAEQEWVVRTVEPQLREYCGRQVLRDEPGRRLTLSPRSDWPWGAVWALWWSGDAAQSLRSLGVRVDGEQAWVEVVEGELAYCYGDAQAQLCIGESLEEVVYARVMRGAERWEFWMDAGGEQARVSRNGAVRAQLAPGRCETESSP